MKGNQNSGYLNDGSTIKLNVLLYGTGAHPVFVWKSIGNGPYRGWSVIAQKIIFLYRAAKQLLLTSKDGYCILSFDDDFEGPTTPR